ncbi:hypothetical protein [Silicimonas sp. MF1-12-2]|uniref:hypothetical protein n=1 Tax=Silicimonas sp. MF1-12-2 TaxID=3384793 RepID=UPI0039B670CB
MALRKPLVAWERQTANLPRHPQSNYYVDLLWNYSTDRPGNFNLRFDEYTYPVYSAAEATGTYSVRTRWNSDLDGKRVPWNPSWEPAPGTDAQIIVIDERTGREWNYFQVSFDRETVEATNASLVPGDYRVRTSGHPPSRGAGIPYLAMLVRPEHIDQGRIPHALSMPIRSPSGVTFVAPATKLERATGRVGVPIGMRFALNITDQDIENWLNSLGPMPAKSRRAARIIAVALRDYGWFITDTSGAAGFQFESNVSAEDEWRRVGLHASSLGEARLRDLLDGLITRDRIYTIVPSDEY